MKELNYSDACLKNFASACDEMINSKFILAESKISNILKVVASSGILFDLFGCILKDFDFIAEFDKCKTPNSFNRVSLRFPSDKKIFSAIIFTLLVEFDSKRRDFMRFLSEYFYSEDGINDSYINFVKSVIFTFKNYVLFMANNDFEDADDIKEADEYFNLSDDEDDDSAVKFSRDELNAIIEYIRGIIAAISVTTSLNIAEREEMMLITEALYNAVISRNDKLVRIAFIGTKNTCKVKKMFEDRIAVLTDMLSKFWDI